MPEGLLGLIQSRLFTRQALLYGLAAACLLFIFLIHLGSQPSRLSPTEYAAAKHVSSLHAIIHNPINAPHDIVGWIFSKFSNSVFMLRLCSVVWALLFSIVFFNLSKVWFGKTIGLIGAAILITTPLFLIAGRQISAEIMFFSPILILAAFSRLGRAEDSSRSMLLLVVLSALLAYVPGMIWWLTSAAIIGRRRLAESLSSMPKAHIYSITAAGLIVICPLAVALAANPHLLKSLALVPATFTNPLSELRRISWMIIAWVVKTPFHSPILLGRLPLLNLVQDALLACGTYALFRVARNKTWVMLASILLAIMAAGLNNNIGILMLGMPFVGLLVATGLRSLYVEWRGVFPSNPAAKYVAILLISALGAVQLLFGIRYALIAWPHSVATHSIYVLKYQ